MKDKSKSRHLLLGSCVALAQKVAGKWLRSGFYTNPNMKIKASVECRDVGVKGQVENFDSQNVKHLTRVSLILALSLFPAHFVFVGLFVFLCCSVLFPNNVSLAVKNSILHNLVSSGLRTMPRV